MSNEVATSLPSTGPLKAQKTAPPDVVASPDAARRQCEAPRARGGRCTSFAMLGAPNCRAHSTDPAVIAASRASSRRGGLLRVRQSIEAKLAAMSAAVPAKVEGVGPAPNFATADGVRKYVEHTVARVQRAELAAASAEAIAKLAMVALKLVELQNERDLIDLEIERARGGSKGGPVTNVRVKEAKR